MCFDPVVVFVGTVIHVVGDSAPVTCTEDHFKQSVKHILIRK